jgi:hypothetical protein
MRSCLLALILFTGLFSAVSYGEEPDADGAPTRRDPFRFGSKVPLGLNMILLQDNDKRAFINGKEYHIGDTVGGSKIVSINFDYIELSHEKGKWRMYVK